MGLVKRGHEVTVYSPSYHPYKDDEYKGVKIKHIYSPETWMGRSIGSFFYDFMSLKDALKSENFDIIYEAGYTSIIPAFICFDVKNVIEITLFMFIEMQIGNQLDEDDCLHYDYQ